MQAAILFAAMVLGQMNCPGGNCAMPSYQPSYAPSYQPMILPPTFIDIQPLPAPQVQPTRPAPRPQPRRDIKRHAISHEGLSFDVMGYEDTNGRIVWQIDDRFNVASYAAAVAERNAAKLKPKAASQIGAVADPFPGGVAFDKIGKRSAYTAPTDDAKRFVQEAQADGGTAGKLHVTVIGSDDERAPVVNDLKTNPALSGLGLMVQGYKPDEWAVDPTLGFQAGNPSIVVQTAKGPTDPKGGRVVYRAKDYSEGPLGLAEAVRKADPNYKPSVDPGPANPNQPANASKCPLGFNKDHWPAILIVGVGLVLLAKLPKKEG